MIPQQGITQLPVLPMGLILGLGIIKPTLAYFLQAFHAAAVIMSFDKAEGLQMATVAVTPSLLSSFSS